MITLSNLTKTFGDSTAVNAIDLEIANGEFFSMLGPSGCGKTTTLRMIAGFEEPTSGRIELAGEDVTWTSPKKRNVNMVFQNYALFPHMTVRENVEFGLKIKKLEKARATERIERMITAVRLEGFESRHPAQLSGGQQQRVALARALVNEPAALLLDEPLGALDLKLRKEMQLELKSIQQQTGTTFVYVTHDQEEALTMSDRVAVMNGGNVEQVDDPRSLYEKPRSEFVADFIGTSNLLKVEVETWDGDIARAGLGDGLRITCRESGDRASAKTITVRPEKINVHAGPVDPGQGSLVRGRIIENVYLGSMTQLIVELSTGERLIVHELNDDSGGPSEAGTEVYLSWATDHSFVIEGAAKAPDQQAALPAGAESL
ncbi:MAG: ABC transporter ATP-binding protein [Solirubrobacterales bacterium]|nr:ABC transporter ATP-binding protein [Solirubrobacterales bacterium]HMT04172.1 ABC transporter ATP-binding protein [Solirubrobacterales bacterium]